MTTKIKALVLDLDDTLYAEISYLQSAYRFIAAKISTQPQQLYAKMLAEYHAGENVFENISKKYQLDKKELLDWYRFHKPDITLFQDVAETLTYFATEYKYAVITDGRSKTQRNKLQALGLTNLLNTIVISEEIGSEKPSIANYEKVMNELQCEKYIYIGDNLKKDFVTAKLLGWTTICLKDQGQNIHKQNFSIAAEYQADHCLNSWQEIRSFLSLDRNKTH